MMENMGFIKYGFTYRFNDLSSILLHFRNKDKNIEETITLPLIDPIPSKALRKLKEYFSENNIDENNIELSNDQIILMKLRFGSVK